MNPFRNSSQFKMIKMKKIIICFLVFAAGLYGSALQAQILSAGVGTEFSIGAGTTVSADGLELTPSALFSISNNTLSKSNTVSYIPSFKYINRVYQFSATAPSFSGSLKMYYDNSELNGNTASTLKLVVHNGTSWSLDNNSSANTTDNIVFNNAVSGVSLREITAGYAVAPLLSVTPLSQTICSGSSITPIVFSDINNQAGTTYSWTRNNTTNIKGISASSGSGQSISGVFTNNTTTAQLTTFTIKATNIKGIFTKTVTLTVKPSLVISKQPAAVSIYSSCNTYFEVGATGVGITYLWQLSTNSGGSWNNIINSTMYAGAITTKLSITKATLLMNGYLYRCIVSSSTCGGPVTSNSAKLTVKSSSGTSASNSLLTSAVKGLQDQVSEVVEPTLVVSAFPNPFASRITFKFRSSITGTASLELFDFAGRKLAVPFQGAVKAGVTQTVAYDVPSGHKVPMVYKFSVGNKTYTGKLLPSK